MTISIIALFVSITTLVVSVIYVAAAARRQAALTTHYCNIENIHKAIPELIMIDSPPLVFPVGKKKLYVKALTCLNQSAFMNEFVIFLKKYSAQLEGLKLYDLDELKEIKEAQTLIEKTLRFLGKKEIMQSFCNIINKVLLSDPLANPNKIKIKYFVKHITPNQLCQIFYAIYAYNVGAEKKNLQSLLNLIGAASSGDKDTALLEYSRRVATGQTNGSDSPFRESPFFPAHLRKSQTGTKQSVSKEESEGSNGDNAKSSD